MLTFTFIQHCHDCPLESAFETDVCCHRAALWPIKCLLQSCECKIGELANCQMPSRQRLLRANIKDILGSLVTTHTGNFSKIIIKIHLSHHHRDQHHPLLAVAGVTGDGRGGPMVCCQLKRTWERGGIWEGADIYVSDALSYLKTGLSSHIFKTYKALYVETCFLVFIR